MTLKTPIARVRGLGTAREGVTHFKLQRLTSVALIPLVLWFTFSIASFGDASYAEVAAWLESPIPATLSILVIITVFWHAHLGMQVVIEDYLHYPLFKVGGLVVSQLGLFALAIGCIVAVLKVAAGA